MIKHAEYIKVAEIHDLSLTQAAFYCAFVEELEKTGHVSDLEKVAILGAAKKFGGNLLNKANSLAANAYSNPVMATVMTNPSLAPAMLSTAGAASVGKVVGDAALKKGITKSLSSVGKGFKNSGMGYGKNDMFSMPISGTKKWQLTNKLTGKVVDPKLALKNGNLSKEQFDYIMNARSKSGGMFNKFNDSMTNMFDTVGSKLQNNADMVGEVATMF